MDRGRGRCRRIPHSHREAGTQLIQREDHAAETRLIGAACRSLAAPTTPPNAPTTEGDGHAAPTIRAADFDADGNTGDLNPPFYTSLRTCSITPSQRSNDCAPGMNVGSKKSSCAPI